MSCVFVLCEKIFTFVAMHWCKKEGKRKPLILRMAKQMLKAMGRQRQKKLHFFMPLRQLINVVLGIADMTPQMREWEEVDKVFISCHMNDDY